MHGRAQHHRGVVALKEKLVLSAAVVALFVAGAALVVSVRSYARTKALEAAPKSAIDYTKLVEARVSVTELAWGISICAERAGKLPPSTSTVPRDIERVQGQMYQTALAEWNEEAFKCADFHLARPQFFQYTWRSNPDQRSGLVLAEADYDGDKIIDHKVQLQVRCVTEGESLRCRPDTMVTAPRPIDLQ